MLCDMFESPIRQKKVRNGVYAYQYRNGCINIEGEQFHFFSMTEAISIWRGKHRLR